MRTEPLKVLVGSVVVYYVMAACSAGSTGAGPSSSSSSSAGGTSAASSAGGASSSSTSSSSSSSGSPVPDANADTTQSGSRLKANYYVGADGSKQFAYFTDSARGDEQCGFATAADGMIRCLPTTTPRVLFSESTCTTGVVEVLPGCTPKYGSASDSSTSCTGFYAMSIYTIAAPYTGPVWQKSGANCVASGNTISALNYFTTGAEVPATSFQSATIGQ